MADGGLALSRRAWTAAMIAPRADRGEGTPASFVSGRFTLSAPTGDELLHVSAQGLYIAFINGVRVGNDYLTPGWTVYDDRIAFQSYPVAGLLKPGENHIAIWLADGWFRSQLMWRDALVTNCWGDRIAAIAEIVSGNTVIAATGADWESGSLPILKSGIYYGESYDARLEGRKASEGVDVLPFDLNLLVRHEIEPVRALPAILPVATWQDEAGRTIHDFGQNCAALVRIEVEGEAGATVLVEHSEQLGPNRAWDNSNYRSARAAFDYTLKGGGREIYEPMFTFMGFRHARVTLTGRAQVTSIRMIPVSSLTDRAGTFTCAQEDVNRLVENTVWSLRSNFVEVPTDCPQRDERLGWSGDAQVFAGTACWLTNSHRFLRKYLRDLMADQRADGAISHFSPDPTRRRQDLFKGVWAGSTGWGDAIVIVPWQLYLHYGDREVLAECLPAMERWLDYLWSISDGPLIRPHARWGQKGFTFGDWLQPVGDNRKPRPTIGDDCAATIYHFISTGLTARIAAILGRDDLAARLKARAERIRAAFEFEFITPSGRLAHNDQTSYALAFLYGLIPEKHHAQAAARFRRVVEDADYLIGTGFIGTPALLPALTRLGMLDVAEKVFLNRKVPGWLYQVTMGATTIWERWDAMAPDGTIYDPDMNSFNHYAYGAVCQWLFEDVAGLRPVAETPGFARLLLDPAILPGLGSVKSAHMSIRGPLSAGWNIEDGWVTYTVTLPEGTGADFDASRRQDVSIDGQPRSGTVALKAGTHVIRFRLAGSSPPTHH